MAFYLNAPRLAVASNSDSLTPSPTLLAPRRARADHPFPTPIQFTLGQILGDRPVSPLREPGVAAKPEELEDPTGKLLYTYDLGDRYVDFAVPLHTDTPSHGPLNSIFIARHRRCWLCRHLQRLWV